MLDLLVVGAGLSGLMAAYAAAQSGLHVRIVSKGLGAMHWSAGTIDLLGYEVSNQAQVVQRPFAVLDRLGQDEPGHPYNLMERAELEEAVASFRKLVETAGLPYVGAGSDGDNLLLPSPAGAARPTYLAPMAQAAGDLSRTEPMVIVGFEGMRDFFPMVIAENLNKLGYQARAILLPLDLVSERRDANNVQYAQALDDKEHRQRLGRRLKEAVQEGERIGLPAILGLDAHLETWRDMETLSGAPVFEIPTLPPSVPGVRLYQVLNKQLMQMGVRVEPGMEIITTEKSGSENGKPGRIAWMASKSTGRPYKHWAEKYLVATGGILGGGFGSDADGHVWEVVVDLPLTVPQDRSEWFDSQFLTVDGHPVFTGGVAVNRSFQPIDSEGALLYENLWAAGQMLAGADPIVERSVEGMAIATGYAAGKAAAR
jgi:glycerol-3-phosphate dehydrogenase subunit B